MGFQLCPSVFLGQHLSPLGFKFSMVRKMENLSSLVICFNICGLIRILSLYSRGYGTSLSFRQTDLLAVIYEVKESYHRCVHPTPSWVSARLLPYISGTGVLLMKLMAFLMVFLYFAKYRSLFLESSKLVWHVYCHSTQGRLPSRRLTSVLTSLLLFSTSNLSSA